MAAQADVVRVLYKEVHHWADRAGYTWIWYEMWVQDRYQGHALMREGDL